MLDDLHLLSGGDSAKELKQLVKILKVLLKGFTFITCSAHLRFLLSFLPRTVSSFISLGEILKGVLRDLISSNCNENCIPVGIAGLGIFVSVPKLQNRDNIPWFYRNFESFLNTGEVLS